MLSAPGCQERQEMMQVEVSVGGSDDMPQAATLHQNKMRNPSSILDFTPNDIQQKRSSFNTSELLLFFFLFVCFVVFFLRKKDYR